MTYEFLRIEVRDAIALVTLDRPPVNAVNQAMYREIRHAFADLDESAPGARAVVLAGNGRHFCAGNDLQEFVTMDPANAPERMREVREAFFALMDAPLPVIGAVHGAALGTGLALAASCDFVIAAAGATFGLPEIGVGVMGGARHLARLVPEPMVRWMHLSTDPVPAETLLAVGGIVAVVEPERLLDEALARAGRIARHSSAALRIAKRSLNGIEAMELKPGYEFEQGLTGELSASPDAKEALRSVIERRKPRFSDRA